MTWLIPHDSNTVSDPGFLCQPLHSLLNCLAWWRSAGQNMQPWPSSQGWYLGETPTPSVPTLPSSSQWQKNAFHATYLTRNGKEGAPPQIRLWRGSEQVKSHYPQGTSIILLAFSSSVLTESYVRWFFFSWLWYNCILIRKFSSWMLLNSLFHVKNPGWWEEWGLIHEYWFQQVLYHNLACQRDYKKKTMSVAVAPPQPQWPATEA